MTTTFVRTRRRARESEGARVRRREDRSRLSTMECDDDDDDDHAGVRAVERECEEGIPGCDAVTIAHNSNLSAGLMFASGKVQSAEAKPYLPPPLRKHPQI